MPWTVTDSMLERVALVAAYNDGLYSVSELAQRHGVSRKTAYKWLDRYQEEGMDGLSDRSRARRTQASRTSAEVEQLLLACRRKHPTWGPRKLVAYLAPRHKHLAMPSASTAGAILKRHGLVEARCRRRRPVHPGRVPLEAHRPNDIWCADFKGQFLLGDASYCYPLTVTDACSRFLLCCHGLD